MQFIDSARDRWHDAGDTLPALPQPDLVFTLAQWQAVRDQWPVGLPTGVRLANDADLLDVAADLPRLALVVLDFPKFTDGRAYSQARLLRTRYRYSGELRAGGDVLVDMVALLHRTGFTSAVLRPDQDSESARRALRFFTHHYQGDVSEPFPTFHRKAA